MDEIIRKVTESSRRRDAEHAKQLAERGLLEKLWDATQGFLIFASYLGFIYVVGIAQLIPVWLGFIIFMLPTMAFVVGVIVALVDPYEFVSLRPSSGGAKITLDGKRKRV